MRGGASAGAAVPPPPRRYVETMFDVYADQFQHHVVDDLGYDAPRRLLALLDQRPGVRLWGSVLDLGCGTGLCAQVFDKRAGVIDDVDLSARMLAHAQTLGRYRELHHADLLEHLARDPGGRDLVLAADVFIYVGELDAVMAGISRVLAPGGCVAFSVEPLDDASGPGVALQPSLRYAHSRPHLDALARRHGLEWLTDERAPPAHRAAAPHRRAVCRAGASVTVLICRAP